MKKILLILSLVTLITGCSIVKIENQSYQEIIDSIFVSGKELRNVSLEGYSYYLPKGVMLKNNTSYNSILYYNHKKMYLYVDIVSYYHKIENTYEVNSSSYTSLSIDKNDKKGYLEINKIEDYYFVEFMYNYAKVEAKVLEEDLKETVTVIAYILNSVQYNDAVLNTLVGENFLDYGEEVFNIFKPKREDGTFLDYDELYQYDDSIDSDEDNIDLKEDTE